jgi:hypothetical protein
MLRLASLKINVRIHVLLGLPGGDECVNNLLMSFLKSILQLFEELLLIQLL